MKKIIKSLMLVAILIPNTFMALNAESFDTSRDYFNYKEGNGKITVKFENLDLIAKKAKCPINDLLKNVSLYKIEGDASDVHSDETDDVLIPVKKIKNDKVIWKIKENGFYYVRLNDEKRATAFGADLISCYLWFNNTENATMDLDVTELNI